MISRHPLEGLVHRAKPYDPSYDTDIRRAMDRERRKIGNNFHVVKVSPGQGSVKGSAKK